MTDPLGNMSGAGLISPLCPGVIVVVYRWRGGGEFDAGDFIDESINIGQTIVSTWIDSLYDE